jgi:hypothetical protein
MTRAAATRIHVGSGNVRIDGFLNVDIRQTDAVDRIGHAGDLRAFGDGTVATLFSHAVLEHLYVGQHLAVLREWRRVLAGDGSIICLAIPDFSVVARLYLEGGPGALSEGFDLFEAYRQTHGDPEHATTPVWRHWNPAQNPNRSPVGWLPQLHKSLFDPDYVSRLISSANLTGLLFNYAYPGERPRVNLGFVAWRSDSGSSHQCGLQGALDELRRIPNVERFVDPTDIRIVVSHGAGMGMHLRAHALDSGPSYCPRLTSRVRRKVRSLLSRLRPIR